RFTPSPHRRNAQVVRRQLFQTCEREFSKPRKKVALFVFQVTAKRGELEVRVRVNKARKDQCFTEILNFKIRKAAGKFRSTSNTDDPCSTDCYRVLSVVNFCRHG